ncbi:ROK family transcriptional regulator [Martelella sp. FLE1502]
MNELLVLDLIRRKGPISRPTLAEQLKLEFQTISTISNRLISQGLVLEQGNINGRSRKARALVVNPAAACSLGAEITRSFVRLVAISFDGVILEEREIALSPDPNVVLDAIAREGREIVETLGLSRGRMTGLGVSVPGPIDKAGGRILAPPNFNAWHGVEVRKALAERTGLPVWMENTAISASLGEQWTGRGRDVENFVFVYMGMGVGAGIVVGGQSLAGATGNAGEFAHVVADPHGPLCSCGQRGCLAQYATEGGLLHLMRRSHVEQAHRNATFTDSFPVGLSAIAEPDAPEWLRATVESAVRTATRTILPLAQQFDPEEIIFGGPLTDVLADMLIKAASAAAAKLPLFGRRPPRVLISRAAQAAGPLGAASLPLHAVYSPWGQRELSPDQDH